MESWHGMCPGCGENIFTGVNSGTECRCNKCGVVWTMTELETYELSHPDEETKRIVNMAMKVSRDLAMEK